MQIEQPKMTAYSLALVASALTATAADGWDDAEQEADWDRQLTEYLDAAVSKFGACGAVIRKADADAAWLRGEGQRLLDAAKRLDAVAERVTQRTELLLREHIALTGEAKVEFAGGWVALRARKSETVEVADVALLPLAFQRVTVAADKTAIKASIKSGVAVPGAEIVPHENESVVFSK